MMIFRRPATSPGQVEKYPPPFMGFLKSNSNGGSRSRSKGRSRASPLFVRRNKSPAAVTQEPSSPKVTCMGQVRVQRSKPKIQPESRENPTRKRCEWIRNASFHNGLAGKIKALSFWPKWKLFTFRCCRQRPKSEKEKDSPISQLDRPVTESGVQIEELNEEENFKIPKLTVSPASSTPPINALLLTRSRSAPYSSSSLAFRFWEENNEREAESRKEREHNVRSESSNSEVAVNEPATNIDGNEVGITKLGFVQRPELRRSKSAPARIGEKTVCFWMKKKVRQGLGLSRD